MPKADAEKIAMEFLERVKIPQQAENTLVNYRGQQQRVAIARSYESWYYVVWWAHIGPNPEMISEVLDVMVDLAEQGMTMLRHPRNGICPPCR